MIMISNIYLKIGIGGIILSIFLLLFASQQDEYRMIFILLVEPFIVLVSIISLIIGLYNVSRHSSIKR